MPDSLPLVLQPRPGKRGERSHEMVESAIQAKVSANNELMGARHLGPPPRDVGRLLERHGASLPLYLDAQRWRDIGAAHRRWPLAWSRTSGLTGETA